MAKDLKTRVILETSTAEARLKALAKAINQVQKAVDKNDKNCYIIKVACESDTGTLITEQRIQEYNQK